MKDWPPQPGLTVMQRTMSARPRSSERASTGVPGLIAIPARQPSSRIAARVRLACGVASSWKVIESAPASAKASMWRSGASIIRWTSTTPPASCTWSAIEDATSGPIVIGGTKWPSMTSKWMTRAPASITSSSCAPSRAEVRREDRRGDPPLGDQLLVIARRSYGPQHRVSAVLAGHVLGGAHPRDRLVFTAVRALRDQLEAAQTVHAAEAAGELCRAQPGLAAARARGPAQHRLVLAPPRQLIAQSSLCQAADEESGRAVAVGADLQAAPIERRGELRGALAEVLERPRGNLAGRARPRAASRSGPRSRGARSCRSSRPGPRPAAGPRPPARRIWRLELDQALDRRRRSCASGRRAARRGCRGPSRERRPGPGRSRRRSRTRPRRSRSR